MISITELLILIISIIIIVLFLIIQFKSPNLETYVKTHENLLNWCDINILLKDSKNGDLIFMSGDSRGEKICRWLSNSIYSHIGMIFREIHPETNEDIVYIWESDLGQKTKDGPRVIKLTDKLLRYKGFKYLMWRKLECIAPHMRPQTSDIMKIVNEYKDYKFDDKMLTWLTSNYVAFESVTNSIKRHDEFFCSELVALSLKKLNILHNNINSSYYSPGIFNKEIIDDINNGYNYGTRQFVKF